MTNEEIYELLQNNLPQAEIEVKGDGYHFEAEIISNAFQDLSRVKRQQLIYDILNPWITSGKLHAISLKTLTPTEKGH